MLTKREIKIELDSLRLEIKRIREKEAKKGSTKSSLKRGKRSMLKIRKKLG